MAEITLHLGDCLEVMRSMPDKSVDTILTDPPYGLTFMGKDWDRGVPGVAFWREALRVAKPGAMLLAMGGTRTFHRLVCAIEDAGWEVRDSMAWLYGSGFPKSYDISKGIESKLKFGNQHNTNWKNLEGEKETAGGLGFNKNNFEQGARPNNYNDQEHCGGVIRLAASTSEAQLWHGWGTALKPAMELICVAMKPIDGTFVNNALTWGVAGLWIDGGRVKTDEVKEATSIQSDKGYWHNASGGVPRINGNGTDNPQGRFPANVIHDGSDEVTGLFPNDAARFFYTAKASRSERNAGLEGMEEVDVVRMATANGTSGVPSKAMERFAVKMQNSHPTVKPLALMRYLARLTKTPTGGVVLDPFMGSGTTGMAAVLEGRDFIGIEIDPDYFAIAEKRIAEARARYQPSMFGGF